MASFRTARNAQPEMTHATRADWRTCRALLRSGSRTFHAAARVLPRHVRRAAIGLYAFCRVADDAIDIDGTAEALTALHARLDDAYAGRPWPSPVDRVFADVVAEYRVPRALPLALLEGLQWDVQARRYTTMRELHEYAARVAGAVGAMMAVAMGARTCAVVARACELGVAMQLTNIARDVGEDARRGRLYLPLSALRAADLDPDTWLAQPTFSPRLATVVLQLLDEADRLYAQAATAIGALPRACRFGIHAAALLYAEIGYQLVRRGGDSVRERAVVPAARKVTLIARALVRAARRDAPAAPLPPLPAVRFLVEAVAVSAAAPAAPRRWDLSQRVAAVIALFERLERRDRAPARAPL